MTWNQQLLILQFSWRGFSIPADVGGVISPGNLLPVCVEQHCLLKSFNPPFTAPLLRICAGIRKGICKKKKKSLKKPLCKQKGRRFESSSAGKLLSSIYSWAWHLREKNPQALSKVQEGSGKVNPGTILPSVVLEAVSPRKMLSWDGLGCPWALQGRRRISPSRVCNSLMGDKDRVIIAGSREREIFPSSSLGGHLCFP